MDVHTANEELVRQFTRYLAGSTKTIRLHDSVRDGCKILALWFNGNLPEGEAKREAIVKIREAMFWANASIACDLDESVKTESA